MSEIKTWTKLYEGPVIIYLSDRDDMRVEWSIYHDCDEQVIAKEGLNVNKIPKGKTMKIYGSIERSYCFCERCERGDIYSDAPVEEEIVIKEVYIGGHKIGDSCPRCDLIIKSEESWSN